MGLLDGPGVAGAAIDLLEREKRLILKGDIDGLRRLAGEKTRLLRRLARARLDRDALDRLRLAAERNNALLAASARGFRAVQERLSGLSGGEARPRTYGRDGARRTLDQSRAEINRKA